MATTALAPRTKRATIFQEGMRRIRAWDSMATAEDKVHEMEIFANVLKRSGYAQEVRAQVIEGVMAREQEMVAKGVRYRSGDEIREQKSANQHGHKNTWFLRGKIHNIYKIQATPGSKLKSSL